MFCENCGHQISDTAKFCSACGHPLAQHHPPVQKLHLLFQSSENHPG